MPPPQPTVYLHIGPPKTGTTYLQDVLWRNRRRLAKQGVGLPGSGQSDHFHAALDLRGIAFGGHNNPAVDGAWARLAGKAAGASSSKTVISHELFAGADDEQISTAVATLAPSAVHVVYGARDLARQLPAVWQESLKNRRSGRYGKFVTTALGQDGTGSDAAFWRSQDAVETLGRWSRHIPADHVHVITLPQAGAPSSILWERFCKALDIDPVGYDLEVARINSSLTVVEAEVLRRLNKALPGDLDWPSYERIVKHRFNLLAEERTPGKKLKAPQRRREAVLAKAAEATAALAAAEYDIVGDLGELTPDEHSFGRVRKASTVKVAKAAVRLLAAELTNPDASGRGSLRARLKGTQRRRGRGDS